MNNDNLPTGALTEAEWSQLTDAEKAGYREVWQSRNIGKQWHDEIQETYEVFQGDYYQYEQFHFDANKGSKYDIETRRYYLPISPATTGNENSKDLQRTESELSSKTCQLPATTERETEPNNELQRFAIAHLSKRRNITNRDLTLFAEGAQFGYDWKHQPTTPPQQVERETVESYPMPEVPSIARDRIIIDVLGAYPDDLSNIYLIMDRYASHYVKFCLHDLKTQRDKQDLIIEQHDQQATRSATEISALKQQIADLKSGLEKALGILTNIRHETDYMHDHYYEWIDKVLNETDDL